MDKVTRFWKLFLELEDRLSGENPSSEAMEQLLAVLKEVDSRLYFHLGSYDGGTDIILSAEGHPDLMEPLEQLKATAPSSPNWGIITSFEGLLVFGQRNSQVFPETENGDVLYGMACGGDHLWIERDIEFNLIFPSKECGKEFAARLKKEGMNCKFAKYNGTEGYSFEVRVTTTMIPTCKAITEMESRLGQLASEFKGKNDGWGCFEVQS